MGGPCSIDPVLEVPCVICKRRIQCSHVAYHVLKQANDTHHRHIAIHFRTAVHFDAAMFPLETFETFRILTDCPFDKPRLIQQRTFPAETASLIAW